MNGFQPDQPPQFRSILWPHDESGGAQRHALPGCFHDLNLDQVVSALAESCPDHEIAPFYYAPLRDRNAIAWRQEILRDLEVSATRRAIDMFVQRMHGMRGHLEQSDKLHYKYEKERLFLAAAWGYCEAVRALTQELRRLAPTSTALRGLRDFLVGYIASAVFGKLVSEAEAVLAALSAIHYGLIIRDGSITVRPFEGEEDISTAILETFAKFRRGAAKGYRARFRERIGVNGLNHIEAQVLDRVALLNRQAFAALDAFCEEHANFRDPLLLRFDHEVHFYLAWLEYIAPLQCAGLEFCYPEVSASDKQIKCADSFDVALAAKQTQPNAPVVRNGFSLHGTERMLVVSGPNHGGKTTFARMFGQLHWLAALGLTVPGTHAKLFLFDRLFTHFEKEEDIRTLRGKLQDDLFRIHRVLDQATPDSLIVMNEIFASTTLEDALFLGRKILARISKLDALGVCVTFLTELAEFDDKCVSMVAQVDPNDPAIRTFRIERRPADGLAYALAIAGKYHVTHDWLLRRIAS